MTRHRMIGTLAAVLALTGLAAPTYAGQPASEAHIRDLIRLAAERVAGGQAGAPPAGAAQTPAPQSGTQSATQPGPARPVVHLTLDDAVKLALERNLDISVQRLNPEINDIAYASIR